MPVGILTIQLHLPGCNSLKEKRKRIKPLLAKMHKEFNVSVAEMEYLDIWQSSTITCAFVSNDHKHAQRYLGKIVLWLEKNWHDIQLVNDQIELL